MLWCGVTWRENREIEVGGTREREVDLKATCATTLLGHAHSPTVLPRRSDRSEGLQRKTQQHTPRSRTVRGCTFFCFDIPLFVSSFVYPSPMPTALIRMGALTLYCQRHHSPQSSAANVRCTCPVRRSRAGKLVTVNFRTLREIRVPLGCPNQGT